MHHKKQNLHLSHRIHVWYISLHEWLICMVFVWLIFMGSMEVNIQMSSHGRTKVILPVQHLRPRQLRGLDHPPGKSGGLPVFFRPIKKSPINKKHAKTPVLDWVFGLFFAITSLWILSLIQPYNSAPVIPCEEKVFRYPFNPQPETISRREQWP